jgi:hypothetical protein
LSTTILNKVYLVLIRKTRTILFFTKHSILWNILLQESPFTYRRGRFPPRKIPSPPPKIETTAASVPEEEDEEVEEGDLEIGGDLGADEDDEDETTNPFYKGQRLIPNHVFESPSLPIRQQVRIFLFHRATV